MKPFYFLILPMLLTGCFGMVARGGYDVATDQRSVSKQIDDAGIRGQIEKDLQQSRMDEIDKITVFCRNGIVVLTGVVANNSGVGTEAVRIARKVHGVKKVETYFLPSQQSQISDFEIEEKIHYKMVGDSDLKADQVDMTVIDGHVVLIGVVSSRAKINKIIAIAHATEGVKAVKSFIQVAQ